MIVTSEVDPGALVVAARPIAAPEAAHHWRARSLSLHEYARLQARSQAAETTGALPGRRGRHRTLGPWGKRPLGGNRRRAACAGTLKSPCRSRPTWTGDRQLSSRYAWTPAPGRLRLISSSVRGGGRNDALGAGRDRGGCGAVAELLVRWTGVSRERRCVVAQTRLLVVDDEELILSFFAAFLRRRGDDFELAANATEALERLERRSFDVLVTDLNMPGMNGIELVARANALQPNLVSILLTGRATKEDMVEAIKANVFDYLEKPVSDLQVLSFAIERAAEKSRLVHERAALTELLKAQNARLEDHLGKLHRAHEKLIRQDQLLQADLGRAQRLQQSLLPRGFPLLRGMDFFGFYQPCEQLGGDFFDVVPLSDGRVAVLVADVAGHGVRSAMVTVILHQLLQAQRLGHSDGTLLGEPALALRYLNQALIAEPFDEPIHVTMGYAVIDAWAGEVVYASAGHPSPIVVRSETGRTETIPARGPGLGLEAEPVFNQLRCKLSEGDFIVLYSDGLTDNRGESGKELSTEGLLRWSVDATGDSAVEVGEWIESQLEVFQSDDPPDDDISFVVLMKTPLQAAKRAARAGESIHIKTPGRIAGRPRLDPEQIAVGWVGDVCVVRLVGRATWERSPALLAVLEQACSVQDSLVYLDLSDCESVDSTVLGLVYRFGPRVMLSHPTERVVEQLAELGVSEHVRVTERPIPQPVAMIPARDDASTEEQMRLVLLAHEALMSESEENALRFGSTVELMRADLGLPPSSFASAAGR